MGINFQIKSEFTCEARNIIYTIFCSGCHKYYIGSTGILKKRIYNHKRDVRKADKSQLVHKHIFDCAYNRNFTPSFKIIPFYKCKTKTFVSRVAVENYFRWKLNPQLNAWVQNIKNLW